MAVIASSAPSSPLIRRRNCFEQGLYTSCLQRYMTKHLEPILRKPTTIDSTVCFTNQIGRTRGWILSRPTMYRPEKTILSVKYALCPSTSFMLLSNIFIYISHSFHTDNQIQSHNPSHPIPSQTRKPQCLFLNLLVLRLPCLFTKPRLYHHTSLSPSAQLPG